MAENNDTSQSTIEIPNSTPIYPEPPNFHQNPITLAQTGSTTQHRKERSVRSSSNSQRATDQSSSPMPGQQFYSLSPPLSSNPSFSDLPVPKKL